LESDPKNLKLKVRFKKLVSGVSGTAFCFGF